MSRTKEPAIRWSAIGVPVAVVAVACVIFVGPTAFTGIDPARVGRDILDGALPYRDFPLEYPPGGALVLALAALFEGAAGYRFAFRALMAVFWGALAWLVVREDDGEAKAGFAMATLAYAWVLLAMFDIVVGFLAFGAWRAARHGRTVGSSTWIAIGVAVKWVTAPLAPFLVAGARRRALAAAAGIIAIAGLVSVALPAAIGGEGSDPLSYQSGRLIHAESTLGSAIVVARLATGEEAGIVHEHRASGVSGVGSWANLTSLAAVAAIALFAWLRCAPGAAASWAAVLLAITAVGPVASPQFLVWPLGFAGFVSPPPRRWYIATGLVSLLYFTLVDELAVSHPVPAIVILARNLVAVIAVVALLREGMRARTTTMLPRTP